MLLPAILFVGLAIFIFIVLRNPRDRTIGRSLEARWLLTGAQVFMCINAIFWLIMGISELRADDLYGALHILVAAMLVVYAILTRRRQFEAGVILAAIGIAVTTNYFFFMEGETIDKVRASMVGGVPFLVFGILLLVATAFAWRKPLDEEKV